MKTIFTRHSFVVHPDSPAVPVMAENLNHETASSSSLTPESHQAAEVTRQAATASPAGEKIDTTPPKDWSKEINDAIENAMGKK